jgi:hypothetical protein
MFQSILMLPICFGISCALASNSIQTIEPDILSDETTHLNVDFLQDTLICQSCEPSAQNSMQDSTNSVQDDIDDRTTDHEVFINQISVLNNDQFSETTPTDVKSEVEHSQDFLLDPTSLAFMTTTVMAYFLSDKNSTSRWVNDIIDDSSGFLDVSIDAIYQASELSKSTTLSSDSDQIHADYDSTQSIEQQTTVRHLTTHMDRFANATDNGVVRSPTQHDAGVRVVKQSELKDFVKRVYLYTTVAISLALACVIAIACMVRRRRKIKTLRRESSLRNQQATQMVQTFSKYSFDHQKSSYANSKTHVDFYEKSSTVDKFNENEPQILFKSFSLKENKKPIGNEIDDINSMGEKPVELHTQKNDDDKYMRTWCTPKLPLTYGQKFIVKGTKSFGVINDFDENPEADIVCTSNYRKNSRLSSSLYDLERQNNAKQVTLEDVY